MPRLGGGRNVTTVGATPGKRPLPGEASPPMTDAEVQQQGSSKPVGPEERKTVVRRNEPGTLS